MADELFADMLALAKRIAQDSRATTQRATGLGRVSRKLDDSVVTDVDHAIQKVIIDAICSAFPDHAIVAEEDAGRRTSGTRPSESRFCWVIDPLDGTRNYVAGFPCYATAIAVLDRGVPVVAVVYEHNLESVYSAVTGEGALCNDRKVRVHDPPDKADLLVGIPSTKEESTVRLLRQWVATPRLILRNVGVSNVHLAMVASGALAAAFGKKAKIWDVAAGALLVSEAGGRVSHPTGAPLFPFDLMADFNQDLPFLSGAPRSYDRLRDTIPPDYSP